MYMNGLRARTIRMLPKVGQRRAIAQAVRTHWHTRLVQWDKLAKQGRLQHQRDWLKSVKDEAQTHNPDFWNQFRAAFEKRGGHFHYAATAEEAIAQVLEIAEARQAKLAVKSKSMVTEEIHLNPALGEAGVEAVETDLGEYIVQLAGETPVHIVGPALHMTRHDVAALFEKHLGGPISSEPDELTALARRVLREKFLTAEIGITGGNAAIAETGSVVIFTNEGNGRMVGSMPPVMINIIGFEKIIKTWSDFEPNLVLLPRSATGQNSTVYVSAMTGPRQEGELDGPEEQHVIVLDAGRSNMQGTRYQEALDCIRCGACLNVCPVYHQIGGHAYGSIYTGPIGIIITPLMKGFVEHADLLDACSLCGACTEACPAQIPLHHLIRDLKEDRAHSAYTSTTERALFTVWAWAWSSVSNYLFADRLARTFARPFVRKGYLTIFPGPLAAWGQGRDFPAPPKRTFHERWAKLEREVNP